MKKMRSRIFRVHEPVLYEDLPEYDEDDGELIGYAQSYYIPCKQSDIRYTKILKAIGNTDFSIKPYITDGIFFIHPQKHIIFFMYDDRGLDVIASDKEQLYPIYKMFNHWILDYDRERIDTIFMKQQGL